jgi:outer membrane protein assembly factor BamD (BamD/ComL family)
VIEQYDGAPSEKQALAIMLQCYRLLGYTELAANVERVYQANYPATNEAATAKGKHWWQFWRH